jgi:hypothetical protein
MSAASGFPGRCLGMEFGRVITAENGPAGRSRLSFHKGSENILHCYDSVIDSSLGSDGNKLIIHIFNYLNHKYLSHADSTWRF